MEKWEIEYYENARGERPVEDFILGLPVDPRTKVYSVLDLMREFGVMVGAPHVKKLKGTGLWELRTSGEVATRILYLAKSGKIFLLLHGFVKKTQKTPEKEMSIAMKRLVDYKLRH
ncbi:MAG: hypothetical protein G01um101416_229 [Microgenomates group bacterium Gr01-1014_16]|nr:MAG: hypothetical protein G01um101416_229 [Microgenomates group bacterium Gr01-1014_16]